MYEFIIKEDGSVVKRETTEYSVNINNAIEKAFQSSVDLRVQNIVDFTDMGEPYFGKCSLSFNSGDLTKLWASTRVKTLNLHTTFAMNEEVMTPTFESEGKFMEIPWTPPAEMKLVLGMQISADVDHKIFKLGKHWLVAYDSKGASWRMPLTNLYDHMELCHGQAHEIHPTIMGTIYTGLKAFRASKWNSDLRGAWHKETAPKMFRFKPLNTGFEQLATELPWARLCTKAAAEIVSTRMQPIEL